MDTDRGYEGLEAMWGCQFLYKFREENFLETTLLKCKKQYGFQQPPSTLAKTGQSILNHNLGQDHG